MRFNKVLLVCPPTFVNIKNKIPGHPPVGLGYIAEALSNNNILCRVVDMTLEYSLKGLIKKILQFQPDLIGFSLMTSQYKDSYKLISSIYEQFPELEIVVGGPHISIFRESVLKECEAINYGVVLEGEQTIVDLCNSKPLDEIEGLLYWKDGIAVYNGDRPFIENLDLVPFPKYSQFALSKYPIKKIAVATTRGCPYNCTYCPNPLTIGRRFRKRSAENVVEEILYWYSRGYREINILDDNFTLDGKRVFEICHLLISNYLKDLKLACPNGIRADRTTKEMLKSMRDAGFSEIALGVEAGTNKVLKNLKKGETIEQIESAIKWACDLNYRITLFFLIGSPGETLKDFNESIKLAKKYPIFSAIFYNIIPFPGTELFQWISERRLFLEEIEEYLNAGDAWADRSYFQTKEMSIEDRKKGFLLATQTSKDIFKKYFFRKLQNFGFLAKPVSVFLANDFLQTTYRKSFIIKRLFRWIGRFFGMR